MSDKEIHEERVERDRKEESEREGDGERDK